MRDIQFTADNHLTLLHGGGDFFPALIAAIDDARTEVYFETYIFSPDETGRQVLDALKRAVSRGVQVHVTDRSAFKSYLAGLALLQTVRHLYPGKFRWRRPPYEYERKKLPMDILCGTDSVP